jgi:hypothetical protein
MEHNYKVGQSVKLVVDRFRHTQGGSFKIIGLLPAVAGDPQYLVKSDLENCRRVVVQSALTRQKQ